MTWANAPKGATFETPRGSRLRIVAKGPKTVRVASLRKALAWTPENDVWVAYGTAMNMRSSGTIPEEYKRL